MADCEAFDRWQALLWNIRYMARYLGHSTDGGLWSIWQMAGSDVEHSIYGEIFGAFNRWRTVKHLTDGRLWCGTFDIWRDIWGIQQMADCEAFDRWQALLWNIRYMARYLGHSTDGGLWSIWQMAGSAVEHSIYGEIFGAFNRWRTVKHLTDGRLCCGPFDIWRDIWGIQQMADCEAFDRWQALLWNIRYMARYLGHSTDGGLWSIWQMAGSAVEHSIYGEIFGAFNRWRTVKHLTDGRLCCGTFDIWRDIWGIQQMADCEAFDRWQALLWNIRYMARYLGHSTDGGLWSIWQMAGSDVEHSIYGEIFGAFNRWRTVKHLTDGRLCCGTFDIWRDIWGFR